MKRLKIGGSLVIDHPDTPVYMSREHVNSKKYLPLPAASDTCFLGLILFEILTGYVDEGL